jgi:ribosomal protein L27
LPAAGAKATDITAQQAPSEPPKTLKERLGDKASDEQRVDNCKVPAARRGTKARPDACKR